MKNLHQFILEFLWLAPYKLQYSIGISLGGGKKSDKSETTAETKVQKKQKTKGKQVAKGTTTTDQEEQATQQQTSTTQALETLSLLDEETQTLLQDLLGGIAGGGQLEDINQVITDRALTADQDLAGLVDPIVANARANLEEQAGQTIQGLARTAGSSQNSLVAQLGLDEAINVEREIADLAAQLGLQTRQIATQELAGAQAGTQQTVVQLAEILKGATQTGESTQQTDALTELLSVLTGEERTTQRVKSKDTVAEVVKAIEQSKTKGKAKSGSFGISL